MKKKVLYTQHAKEFIDTLGDEPYDKFIRATDTLEADGTLYAPDAEKVIGYKNLFEIRIRDRLG